MKRLLLGTVAISAWAAWAVVGCNSSSSNNPSDGGETETSTDDGGGVDGGADAADGTVTDSGTATDSSSNGDNNVADSGSPTDTGSPGDAGDASSPCTTGTLYTRLHGHAGIRAGIHAIILQELADPEISTYFFNQIAMPIPAGHPDQAQIEECFTDLLGSVAGGTESYPPDGGVDVDDAGAFACRNLATIHQPLLISGGTFNAFLSIAAAELSTLGICPNDIMTLGADLTATEAAIVKASLADAGKEPYPGVTEAGTEAGSEAGSAEAGSEAGTEAGITDAGGQ